MAYNGRKKGGIFARLTRLPERSEDYARKTLPSNRWALAWDLIRNNFGKLFKINLLMLLFIFPVVIIIIARASFTMSQAAVQPFAQNIGIGYPAYPMISGISESIVFQVDVTVLLMMLIVSPYVSVGLAGGFYVMRNLVWTEGVFVASDFWSGVKKNYKNTLFATLFYLVMVSLMFLSIDLAEVQIATMPKIAGWFIAGKAVSVILIIYFTFVYLYMLTLGVTYKVKFTGLIKNGFLLAFALLPYNAFFAALSVVWILPLFFTLSSTIFMMIGIMLAVFLSFSLFTLIWTNYSQWVFDEFINDKVAGAKKNRGIYKKNADEEVKSTERYKPMFGARPIKPVTDYDIEIAELPESYTREDLIRLQESKDAMIKDSERYEEEHKDDFMNAASAIDEFMGGAAAKSDETDEKINDADESLNDADGEKPVKSGKKSAKKGK